MINVLTNSTVIIAIKYKLKERRDIMTTQLAITPVIKGNKILEIIKDIEKIRSDESFSSNIEILKRQYKGYVDDEEL